MRGHAAALAGHGRGQHLRRHRRGRAPGPPGDPPRRAASAPTRGIVVTGCAAQIAPDAWAALPGVRRVLGNAEKLEAANAGLTAPVRGQRHHGARARPPAHLVDRLRRPRPRLRPGAAGLRPPLHVLHHPVRPRPDRSRADRRGGRAGARPGADGLPGGGADRRRHHQLRPDLPGQPTLWASWCARILARGARTAAAAALLARPGRDR